MLRAKGKIPGWFIALVVLVTGGLTGWAIMKRKDSGQWPLTSPLSSPQLPMKVTEVLAPPMMASAGGANYQQVAAVGGAGAPMIQMGAAPKHPPRGACALCHVVVDTMGKAIPAISTFSAVPHAYRGGLCVNCHAVKTVSTQTQVGANTKQQINSANAAATPPPTAAFENKQMPTLAVAAVQPKVPTEGAWMGMEVVPITPLTAQQYTIPAYVRGLVVAEAEGQAATDGVQAGDVLVAVNGMPVSNMQAFLQATNGQTQGGKVDILRSGKFIKVLLGQAKGAAMQQAAPAAQQAQPAAQTAPNWGAMGYPGGGQARGNGMAYQGGGMGPGMGMGQGLRRAQNGGTCPNAVP